VDTNELLLLIALWFAHESVTWNELRYVVRRREVGPVEQIVHGFLEVLPLAAVLMLAALNPEQALGVFDWGTADWSLRMRACPEPVGETATLVGVTLLLPLVPLLEENLRCRRKVVPLRGPRLLYP